MKKYALYLPIALTMLTSHNIGFAQEDTVEYYTNSPTATLSKAVRVGNMLYLSGEIGTDPATGELAPGGVEAETHQIMKNIKANLEKYGSSMDEVVKCTVFMANPEDRNILNRVYRSYFGDNPPARSGIGSMVLARDATAEIECMATVGLKKVN